MHLILNVILTKNTKTFTYRNARMTATKPLSNLSNHKVFNAYYRKMIFHTKNVLFQTFQTYATVVIYLYENWLSVNKRDIAYYLYVFIHKIELTWSVNLVIV